MKLTNQNIAEAVKEVQEFFEELDVIKQDKIKICFLIEESLLRYQEKFDEDKNFSLVTKKWFGTPKILIKIKGAPYNPIEDNSEENIFSEQIIKNLSNYEQAGLIYSYKNGCNEITATINKEIKNLKVPGGSNTISILLAIFLAIFIKEIFSPTAQTFITDEIVTPILNVLLGTLIAANIPMIFISIVASICNIEDVTMLNNLGTKILKRFFVIMFLISGTAIFISGLFFPVINFSFGGDFLAKNTLEFKQIFQLILSIVPQNIFTAFIEQNILQIVFIAWLTGFCITILGSKVSRLKEFVLDIKQLIYEIVKIIFKLIPAIMFLCILKTTLTISFSSMFAVWKIVVAVYTLDFVISSIMLLRIKIKHGIKILDFLKKIYPAFLISFVTCNGSAAMPKNIEVCEKELKIDKNLCEFYIPLANALFPTTMVMAMVINPFFAAEFSGVEISIAKLLIILFLSIQFAISSVRANGGMIATMTLLLTQLDFSLDAMGLIMIADIFVINMSGVISLIIRNCDLLDFSRTLK